VIEVHAPDLRHLFNAIDPSPFRERDLSREAESFIVDWAVLRGSDTPLESAIDLRRRKSRARDALFKKRVSASRRCNATTCRPRRQTPSEVERKEAPLRGRGAS